MKCADVGPSKLYGLEQYHRSGFLGMAGRRQGETPLTQEEYEESRRRLFARNDGDEDKTGIKFWMMAMLKWEVEACAKIADQFAADFDALANDAKGTLLAAHYHVRATDARDMARDIRARTTTGGTT